MLDLLPSRVAKSGGQATGHPEREPLQRSSQAYVTVALPQKLRKRTAQLEIAHGKTIAGTDDTDIVRA